MLLAKKENNATFTASHTTHNIWNKYYASIWKAYLNFSTSVAAEAVT